VKRRKRRREGVDRGTDRIYQVKKVTDSTP
jgi:hypothetical protein